MSRHALLASAALAAAVPAGVAAQAVPSLPRPPTREEVERPQPPAAQGRPRLTVEGGVERAPCALQDAAYSSIRVTLSAVSFEGLKGLPADALQPAFADYLGKEQPISVVCEIRDRAATILRSAGYVAAVEIPEQRIADGTLRLEVLMAKLVAVRVRGDAGRAERTIAGYLEKLTEGEAFNRYEAERYLLLARDLPGYDIRLTLRSAGAGRGEVIGEVTVERAPGLIEAGVQNYGSSALGRWGGLVRGEVYGLTGLGDRTSLAFYSTADPDEQKTLQVGHDFRVGTEGLMLGGQFTYAWARPDLDDPSLDLRARTSLATLEASYPLLRAQSGSLRGGLGLDLIDQRVRLNGLPLSRDKLRVAFGRLQFDRTDRASLEGLPGYTPAEPRWRFAGTVELRQGLSLLGASRECGPAFVSCVGPGAVPLSRLEGDPSATLLRFEGLAEFRPQPKLTLALGLRAQTTDDPLLGFEQFAGGNYTAGRGYDPGIILGDRGLGVQSELRYGSLVPRTPDTLTLEPYAFFDFAKVSEAGRIPILPAGRTIASAGAGLRASLGDHARLDAVLAVPLRRAGLQAERGDPRFLLSITTRLWPWSRR